MRSSNHRRAFTLVELLVVVGIISVLVAILMPALSRARATAQRVECMSNIRQLGMAALMYANDHRGRVPPYNNNSTATPVYYQFYPAYLLPYLGYRGGSIDPTTPTLSPALEIRNGRCYKSVANTTTYRSGPYFCPSTVGSWDFPTAGIYGGAGAGVWYDYGINPYIGGIIGPNGQYDDVNFPSKRLDRVSPSAQVPLFMDSNHPDSQMVTNWPPMPNCPRHLGQTLNLLLADMHVENAKVVMTHSAWGVGSNPEANLLYDLSPQQCVFYGFNRTFTYYQRPN